MNMAQAVQSSNFRLSFIVFDKWKITQLWSATITLKAFANFSLGLRFGNPGKNASESFKDATLKWLPRRPSSCIPVATPSELRPDKCALFTQGFKANAPIPRGDPGLGLN
jgi:hypothetical protein